MKALSFNGVSLTPVHHNSQIYLTSIELAKALGYSQENAVLKVYHRNSDEFSADMTQVISNPQRPNLGQRIFSLRGCHLIAMFARTAVAKEFRKWVLDILGKQVGEPVQVAKITDSQAYQIQKAIKAKCLHNKLHYQTVYHSLYAKFGVKSYKDILASDFEQALAFIAAFALGDEINHNAFWRMVGILEYDRISRELRQLQDTLDVAQRQLNHISRTKGLLYDSLGEQRLSTKAPVVDEARKFIEKQMAFKKRIGLIT